MKNKCESLYVHIPFCDDICSYCDFCKLIYNKKWADDYIVALFNEIDFYNIKKVKTLYVGGGTPTSLTDEQFEKLLSKLEQYLDKEYEFTVEANVESLSKRKLELMKKYNVNRLSIGIQSSDDDVLKLMDRHYTFEEAKTTVKLAKEYLNNINVDLIYAYPSETLEQLNHDIDSLLSLDVDHISTYSLTIDKSTKYFIRGFREASQDIQREMYDEILRKLRNNSYKRYEVSNFARNDKYSRHNLTYWNNKEYFGVGLGASGYINGIRYTNTKNLSKYLKGDWVKEKEELSESDKKEYFIILKLRLENGFTNKEYIEEFGIDFLREKAEQLDKLLKQKLIKIENDTISPTDEGIMLLDRILLELI